MGIAKTSKTELKMTKNDFYLKNKLKNTENSLSKKYGYESKLVSPKAKISFKDKINSKTKLVSFDDNPVNNEKFEHNKKIGFEESTEKGIYASFYKRDLSHYAIITPKNKSLMVKNQNN